MNPSSTLNVGASWTESVGKKIGHYIAMMVGAFCQRTNHHQRGNTMLVQTVLNKIENFKFFIFGNARIEAIDGGGIADP